MRVDRQSALATEIEPSDHHFEWLGTGFYLWQDSPWRAQQWAVERFGGDEPVVAARVSLAGCLDLLNPRWHDVLSDADAQFVLECIAEGRDVPVNHPSGNRAHSGATETPNSPARSMTFAAEGLRVIKTPVRAPRANAYAERFVRTVRAECLDWMLICNRRHLERVLSTYVVQHNRARPHRGIDLEIPEGHPVARVPLTPLSAAAIRRRDVLGRLIHEYQRAAA